LEQAWSSSTGDEVLAVEFGLAHEFMLPLTSGKLDPFIGNKESLQVNKDSLLTFKKPEMVIKNIFPTF
jgi:hypothetical protein